MSKRCNCFLFEIVAGNRPERPKSSKQTDLMFQMKITILQLSIAMTVLVTGLPVFPNGGRSTQIQLSPRLKRKKRTTILKTAGNSNYICGSIDYGNFTFLYLLFCNSVICIANSRKWNKSAKNLI